MKTPRIIAALGLAAAAAALVSAQTAKEPDWKALEDETMRHYQAVLRLDTRNPPGNEHVVVDYVKGVLEKEGIAVQVFASDANRSNLVARIKGNGKKRPLLVMGHSDTVTTDEKKWTYPPLSATRNGGWVYGRGTIDGKDNLTSALVTMVELQQLNVPLDRDVLFLFHAGAGGSNGRCRRAYVSR